jgi:flagellar M-ring protein FliF
MATAIQHLVASAVDHLSPLNVSIMDASGQMSLVNSPGGTGSPAQTQLEDALRDKILATLAPVVGAAHVRASVAVEYDPTSADDTQETYDPQATAVLSSQSTSTVGASAAGAAGVPGTTSNLPKAQAPGTSFNAQLGVGTTPGEQSENQTFAVSRSVNHIVRPAGTIQRVTAAVVIDDGTQTTVQQGKTVTVAQPRSATELTQLQALAAAAIGIDTSRGDVLTISNLPFTAPPAAAPAPEPAPVSPLQTLESAPALWGGALLLLLLLAGGWLLMRPRAAAAPPPAPAGAQLSAQAAGAADYRLAADADRQASAVTASQSAAVSKPLPEFINVTDLLKASPLDVPPELQSVMQLKERVAERVKHEPAVASRLVRVWMNKRREETS